MDRLVVDGVSIAFDRQEGSSTILGSSVGGRRTGADLAAAPRAWVETDEQLPDSVARSSGGWPAISSAPPLAAQAMRCRSTAGRRTPPGFQCDRSTRMTARSKPFTSSSVTSLVPTSPRRSPCDPVSPSSTSGTCSKAARAASRSRTTRCCICGQGGAELLGQGSRCNDGDRAGDRSRARPVPAALPAALQRHESRRAGRWRHCGREHLSLRAVARGSDHPDGEERRGARLVGGRRGEPGLCLLRRQGCTRAAADDPLDEQWRARLHAVERAAPCRAWHRRGRYGSPSGREGKRQRRHCARRHGHHFLRLRRHRPARGLDAASSILPLARRS